MAMQEVADAAAAARVALDQAERRHPQAAAAAHVTPSAAQLAHYQDLADQAGALELDTPAGRLRGGSRADGPLIRVGAGEPGAGWWDQ
jgi:hypothetical protein